MGWVHASERLSLLHLGKAPRGNAKVKTGIGKSDLPGLQGGPRKRDLVIYDKVRASRLYPDHVRICERLGVQLPGPTPLIVLHESSLRRTLKLYFDYYHRSRTHLSLGKDSPEPRATQPPEMGTVVAVPQVGGLHYCYERRAA